MTQLVKRKRILHVSPGLGLGGAETMLYRIATCLNNDGDTEHIILGLNDICHFDFERVGLEAHVIGSRGMLDVFMNYSKIKRLVRDINPDLIQGWMYIGNILASLIAPNGVQVVWSIHNCLDDFINETSNTKFAIYLSCAMSRCIPPSQIIYCADKSQHQHIAFGYKRSLGVVIPNGVDPERFRPAVNKEKNKASLGIRGDSFVIGSFGRYFPVKNHKLLIESFSLFSKRIDNAILLLAGLGINNRNEFLTGMIKKYGVSDNVILCGDVKDIENYYQCIDCYALTSRSEAFPNVLVEAISSGVPCVTTDVGDARNIVGEFGFVSTTNNASDFVDCLQQAFDLFAKDDLVQFSLRAHRSILSRFSIARVSSEYNSIYIGGQKDLTQ